MAADPPVDKVPRTNTPLVEGTSLGTATEDKNKKDNGQASKDKNKDGKKDETSKTKKIVYGSLLGVGALAGVIGLAVIAKDCGGGPEPVTTTVKSDFPLRAYTDTKGDQSDILVVETPDGKEYRFPGKPEVVDAASRRIKSGDEITFFEGNLDSLKISKPYKFGEIPFGRYLNINHYEIIRPRDMVDTSIIEQPIAELKVRYADGKNDEEYTIIVTGISNDETYDTVQNMVKYGTVMITEQKYSGRGSTGSRIEVRPTERGLELQVPLYRMKFADNDPFTVQGHQPKPEGTISPGGVRAPWQK